MLNKSYPSTRDVIKFLYKETTDAERNSMLPDLFESHEFQEEFNELLDVKEQLDDIPAEEWVELNSVPSPSKGCISRILDVARLDKPKGS